MIVKGKKFLTLQICLIWLNYKIIRNNVNNLKKHAKERFYNNLEISLLDSFTNSKKDYWKIIRHFVKNKDSTSEIPPLTKHLESGGSVYYTTDKEKADCLNLYFTSVSTVDDSQAVLPPLVEKTNQYLENIIIMDSEVEDILDILNVNKASGPDMISNRMLKYTSTSLSKPLSILYNRSIKERIFPEPWKHSQVVPIYKKGERTIPANYRPVSLLSNVATVFERVLFKHIYNHLYILIIYYISTSLDFYRATLQLCNSLIFITISVNLLMRNNILAWCIAIFQKLSTEFGTGVYYSN